MSASTMNVLDNSGSCRGAVASSWWPVLAFSMMTKTAHRRSANVVSAFKCPRCACEVGIESRMSGRERPCPHCARIIQIPSV